jgi:RND family efflux transporter MFP subunit
MKIKMEKSRIMKIKTIYCIIIILVSASFFIYTGCGKNDKQNNNIELNEIIPVSITTAQKRDISNKRTYSGSLEGIKQSNVVAKISERIVSINVAVDQYVNAGQVVVIFDKTGPSSQYIQASANFENTKREFERMKALYSEGAVAKQAVDQAQTAYEVAQANYEASKSAVELVSPISGRVTAVNVNPGDWVTAGSVLAVVADISRMVVIFNVSEAEIGSLKIGSKVRVYSEFNKELIQRGKIIELNRSASIDARSFRVKAEFPNTKDNFYKPGMFSKVDVILETRKKVLTVPTASIINELGSSTIYAVRNNRSFAVRVNPGFSNEEFTEITAGLSDGDTIVTAGMNNLSDSAKVSVVTK